MSSLPFYQCGINRESIEIDGDGVTYTLKDGRKVSCPSSGGVWIGYQQVSGTCDAPYRYTLDAAKEAIKPKKILWAVWSGEGEIGTVETKKATLTGIKRILTKERCGGDCWAHACPDHLDGSRYCSEAKRFDLKSCTESMIDEFYDEQKEI